jgi:AcrR family transcriptional regulator
VGPDHGGVGRGQDRLAEPGEVARPPGERPPGQIAASADISRRGFFRYSADKEELFFAEDERLLARERLIAATPALEARRMAKTPRWEEAIAARLVARGSSEEEALLVPKLALACFQTAYQRWVRDPGQDLTGLVDDSFTALARLTG